MAHLRSNVDFRVPRAALSALPPSASALEASALFVKGRHDFKKPDGRYEIEVRDQDYVVRLNGGEATRFCRAAADQSRGNPPSADPDSGFIGVQTHTGAVAFANIRIKTP